MLSSEMMKIEDLNYYEQRAEVEIELAARARDSRVVQAHYQLANFYLDRIHGDAAVNAGASPSI